MSNPHINLALVLLAKQRRDQEFRARTIRLGIQADGNGLRIMSDDRTLGEHLADAEQALAHTIAAIEYLESLQ